MFLQLSDRIITGASQCDLRLIDYNMKQCSLLLTQSANELDPRRFFFFFLSSNETRKKYVERRTSR